MINRREALRRTALLMGAALSAPAIAGVLNGCSAKPSINWKPEFLSSEQGTLISQLSEIIIPKTDTPGAIDVGVPEFIDKMLKDVYSKEDQDRFIAGLNEFDDAAQKESGDVFIGMDVEDQLTFVTRVHKEGVETMKAKPSDPKPFIMAVKELTLLGYFTSEVGATKVLQYAPVPGAYKGCVPLEEAGNGKTWAT